MYGFIDRQLVGWKNRCAMDRNINHKIVEKYRRIDRQNKEARR